jgi:RNA polymerase sigma factor (sigma-70 family)
LCTLFVERVMFDAAGVSVLLADDRVRGSVRWAAEPLSPPARSRPIAMSPRISIRLLSGQSDERLLALARGGHERAFEALVQRYRRPLLRFCRRTMRLSDGRAEDVVQQSLLKAWIALAAGTEVRDFKPWLYSIVRNTALNAMRGYAESNVALTDALRSQASADSELEHRLEMRDALTHVAALPQAQREAIVLTVIDGQSHEEVASALGITGGAVRGLLYRARTTLRRATAAITPQPLIAWAAGSAGPSTERAAEVTSGAAALGAGGLLAKGAVLAVTAGTLATGAVVQLDHTASHDRATHAVAETAGVAQAPGAGSAQWSSASPGRGGAATASTRTAAATRGASPTSSTTGAHAGGGASGAAPTHRSSTRTLQHVSEHESSGPSNGTSTVGASSEPPAPAQTQPEAPPPPPTEQPKGGEPTAPGGAEPGNGVTTPCPTTQTTEQKPCDE